MSKLLELRKKILLKIIPSFFWPNYKNVYGIKIPIRNSGYSTGTKWAIITRRYEKEELYFVNKYINEGSFVLELGASLGIVTRLISKKIGVRGKVVAVEASPKIYESEKTALKSIPNVLYLNGLGFPCNGRDLSKYRKIKFHEASSNLGGKISKEESSNIHNKIYDLGTLEEGYSTYCLVVDIEGAEIELLENGAFIESRINIIIIELHPGIYGSTNEKKILNKILDNGFKIIDNRKDVFVFSRVQ